jgi:hypothetical protein
LRLKIEYLVTHPDEGVEMGKNGRKLVEEMNDPHEYYKKLMEIYTKVIDGYKRKLPCNFKGHL